MICAELRMPHVELGVDSLWWWRGREAGAGRRRRVLRELERRPRRRVVPDGRGDVRLDLLHPHGVVERRQRSDERQHFEAAQV